MENTNSTSGQDSWRRSSSRPRPQPIKPEQPKATPVASGAPPLPSSVKTEVFTAPRPQHYAAAQSPHNVEDIKSPAQTKPDDSVTTMDRFKRQQQKLQQRIKLQSERKPAREVAAKEPVFKTQPAQKTDGNTNVTINIAMPQLKKPTLPAWPWRKIAFYAGIAAALIIASIIIRLIILQVIEHRREEMLKNRLDMAQPAEVKAAPSFKPLIPKSNEAVAKTASFDGQKDSYSFSDTLKGTSIIVSQQPMKTDGKSPADVVAKVARAFDASTPLVTSTGTAYLAKDTKTGGQMVVLGTPETLVFVQSPIPHTNNEWIAYLDGLQTT